MQRSTKHIKDYKKREKSKNKGKKLITKKKRAKEQRESFTRGKNHSSPKLIIYDIKERQREYISQ